MESQSGFCLSVDGRGEGLRDGTLPLLRACGSFSEGLPGRAGGCRPALMWTSRTVPSSRQSWRQEAQEAAEGEQRAQFRFMVPKSHSAAELC